MKLMSKLAAGIAGTVLMSGTAMAGDFGGAYVGTTAGVAFVNFGGFFIPAASVGARVGYDFSMGNIVAGVDAGAAWLPSFGGAELSMSTRIGAAFGPVLWYTNAGLGWFSLSGASYFSLGTGLEGMVTESISLRADYQVKQLFGIGLRSHNFSGGVSFHFGN